MTTAELIFEDKQIFQDGSIIEDANLACAVTGSAVHAHVQILAVLRTPW